MIRRLARQALAAFLALRDRRRAERAAAALTRRVTVADPEIARLQGEIAKRAARHRNAAPLRRELRNRVVANLAREQGITIQERKFS
jgi:uncharacterized lipoprotein YmbA